MRIAFKVKEGEERAYEGARTSQRHVQLLHRQRGPNGGEPCRSLCKLKVSAALASIQVSAWSPKWSCHRAWWLPAITTGSLCARGTGCSPHLSASINSVNPDATVHFLLHNCFFFFCVPPLLSVCCTLTQFRFII